MSTLLKELSAADRSAPALVDANGTSSWAELDDRVNRAIALFASRGLGEGDTIAVMAGNQRETFELALACMQTGVLMVPVNWHWVADELRYVVENSDANLLVVDERWKSVADTAALDIPTIVISADPVAESEQGGVDRWDDLLAASSPDEPADAVRGGVMFYTSGTTGFPKGVKGSLAQTGGDVVMWQLMAGSSSMFDLPAEHAVFLLAGPVYHSAQWVYSMFSLLSGATVVMQHKYDAAELLALVEEHEVTNLHLVPTQFTRLLRLPDEVRTAHDLSSLVAVHHGAAPCPDAVKRSMIDWLGPIVTEYYGGTEGGFISIISAPEWLERPRSVGKPVGLVEVTVTDEQGEPVPANTPGQLWFRSLMGGDFEYHGAKDKTADAHREPGVGTLGDVGYFDDEGYLFLSDRKIDMIISGGVNIYPAEVELVLNEHPAVDDAAVFGVPDDEFGESVMAIVEAPGAANGLADELIELCRERLAGYKRPRAVEVVDELPRSEAGKLQKRKLRDPYWESTTRQI